MYRQHTFEHSGSILNRLIGSAEKNVEKIKNSARKKILTAEKKGRKALAKSAGKMSKKINENKEVKNIKNNIFSLFGRKRKPKKQQLKKPKPLTSSEILGKILERLSSIEGLLAREVRTNDALRKYKQSVNIVKTMTEQKRRQAKKRLKERLKKRREARQRLNAVA